MIRAYYGCLGTSTYPDNPAEQVVYGVNAAGQVVSLRNTSTPVTTYLSNLTYDEFGRPLVIMHGNGTTDTRTYGTETANFRLASIATTQGSNIHLNLSYASYNETGLLTQLTDLRNGSGDLSNTATYTYDGLGRLTQASGVKLPPPNTYGYDALGNMTLKEGTTFGYSATKPHTLATINGSPTGIGADPNGNRAGKPNQSYGYTKDDRVETITVGGQTVTEYYDYTGRQVARQVGVGSTWTRYYSELAEQGPDGYLTKHYFAGGLRIAPSRVYAPQLWPLSVAPFGTWFHPFHS